MGKNREYKTVFVILGIFFVLFLAVPVIGLLLKSVVADGGLTLENYKAVFGRRDFSQALKNSFLIASCSAGLTTILAFILAYTVNYTNVPQGVKKFIQGVAVLPMLLPTLTYGFAIGGSKSAEEQVIIYSNADEEAIEAMSETLDENGYKEQYIFQTFGTSELGGKLLAEGKNLEADMVTMSTFYVDSAQEENKMFKDLEFDVNTLDEFGTYCAPITSQEGTIIINTDLLKESNLPTPTCLKDLADPVYKDMISVTNVASSSTAWLLIQALVSEYGEDGAKDILTDIYKNAGDYIEESGSGPLKKLTITVKSKEKAFCRWNEPTESEKRNMELLEAFNKALKTPVSLQQLELPE